MANRMQKQLGKLNVLPTKLRLKLTTLFIRKMIPFVGTAKIRFESVTPEKVVAVIPNQKRNQNHIQSVHAAATALLAETSSGICFGLNLPDDKLPLLKSMHVQYTKRTQGDLTATTTLTDPAEIQRLNNDEKGDITFDVEIRDETGELTNITAMTWAWIPKKRS